MMGVRETRELEENEFLHKNFFFLGKILDAISLCIKSPAVARQKPLARWQEQNTFQMLPSIIT